MINEVAVAVALTISGSAMLTAVRRDVTAAAGCWLSLPIGAAVYSIVALVSLVIFGTLDPAIALLVALGLGLVVAAISLIKGGIRREELLWMLAGVGLAALTAVAARQWHLTRLTPDSLRYLLASNDLVLTEGLREMNAVDLVTRQIGLPALHSLSDLVGRRYLASIGPLFGAFGLGLFVWLAAEGTRGALVRRNRMVLVATATLFLLSSNRLVYDSFYINTHIQMASYLLIAVAGTWLAVSRGLSRWAVPSGLALAVTLVFRPEAPLVVAIVLVTVAASRANLSVRLAMTLPTLAVGALWYGLGLWRYAAGGDEISPTAPVFGSLLAIGLAIAICLVAGASRARPWARWLDRAGVAGLALLLVFYVATDPAVFGMSIEATARNLVRDGFWLLTWVAAIALLLIALAVETIPDARLWTIPVIGFALLYWALPYIREGAWRVGAGDSGNRILAHYLAVVVVFLVLAAAHNRGRASDGDVATA